MAGTIIADVIQSDQSYPSSINIASPVIISNTFAIPAGTVGAPALSPVGDTNTGIFFPAADTIAFAEGGAEAMRIDSSGNVGIGTSSPDRLFHLVSSGTTTPMRIDSGGSSESLIDFKDTATTADFKVRVGSSGDNFVAFAGGSERMRIDSSGNVGIGTSSPSEKLTVSGTGGVNTEEELIGLSLSGGFGNSYFTQFYGASAANTGTRWILPWISGKKAQIELNAINSSSSSGGQIKFLTADTERMSINSSGGLILVGSTAQKATGTTWSNPSDQRLKDNIRDYTKGTAELMQVRVREWEYNGKGGTIEGTKGLGVVADEVMVVLPDTVANYEAKLNADDEEVTSIKKFDATEITWLLVKTVQELKAELDTVKAELATLKGN